MVAVQGMWLHQWVRHHLLGRQGRVEAVCVSHWGQTRLVLKVEQKHGLKPLC